MNRVNYPQAKDLWASNFTETCPSCELVNKRDLNAANNILAEGIRLYRTRKKTSSEAS